MLFASNAGGENGIAWLSAMKVRPADCARLVDKLLQGITSPVDRANAIQRFVVNNISTVNLPVLLSADIREPSVVLSSAYGTPAEKAALMASMLLAANLDAQILAAFPIHAMPTAVGALTDIRVRTGGRFLSPVRMDAPDPALRATRDQFWLTGDDGVNMVQIVKRAARLACSAQITLGKDEATVEGTVTDSEDPAAKPDFIGKTPLQSSAGYTVYALPVPRHQGLDAWRLTLGSTRTQPYELPYALTETCDYTIDLGGRELKTRHLTRSLRRPPRADPPLAGQRLPHTDPKGQVGAVACTVSPTSGDTPFVGLTFGSKVCVFTFAAAMAKKNH